MSSSEEEIIDANLTHFNRKTRRALKKIVIGKGLIALWLDDLLPLEVTVEHDFELKIDEPIYHKLRRMSPKYNIILKGEIQNMLRACVIKLISSAWSFPVVIGTKEDVKPFFCVYYRTLKQRIKAYIWPLPKTREIFDDTKGQIFFSSLNFFIGYWQYLCPSVARSWLPLHACSVRIHLR